MGAPLRRQNGSLVNAHGFALVTNDQPPIPATRAHWSPPNSKDARDAMASDNTLIRGGYGRAWRREDMDIARLPGASRKEVLTTDRNLQTGPAPGRIARQNEDRDSGLTGPDVQNSFPGDGGTGYIPHIPANRLLHGIAGAQRTISDDARVPALFVENAQ